MVQIIQMPMSPKALSQSTLARALGEGLGNFTGSYFADKSLNKVLNDPKLHNAPLSEKMSALESSLRPYGERGQKMLQTRLQIEQQAIQEQEQQVLGDIASGKEISPEQLSKLRPENQFKVMQIQKNKQAATKFGENLKKMGFPNEIAENYQNMFEEAPTGGKTDVVKRAMEDWERNYKDKPEKENIEQEPNLIVEVDGFEDKPIQYDFPELKEKLNLTQKENIKFAEKNKSVNTPIYLKSMETLNYLEDEKRDIERLQQLEETKKLPTGLEKWNVDWETGEPRALALLGPEGELYVKTIAKMLGTAKNFFPGRVTNFDLEQFKRRFPTLANSPEGRKLISKQLELANRIAYLKEETNAKALEHYGTEADPAKVRQIANQNYKKQKSELEDRLKSLDGMLNQEFNKNVPDGYTMMKRPNGEEIPIANDQVQTAIDKFKFEVVK